MDRISAVQQFRAIAYLRWCLFRNGFRRKGGAGEAGRPHNRLPLCRLAHSRPVTAATVTSYFAISTAHPAALNLVFWAIFALQILVSIQIAAPGLSFDPTLIAHPLPAHLHPLPHRTHVSWPAQRVERRAQPLPDRQRGRHHARPARARAHSFRGRLGAALHQYVLASA